MTAFQLNPFPTPTQLLKGKPIDQNAAIYI